MKDVTLRDADARRWPDLVRITEQAWHVAYSDIYSQETIDATMAEVRESDVTRQFIEREEGAYFVADPQR